MFSEVKVCTSVEALTVTAPSVRADALPAPRARLIAEGWPSCR
ncbi:hypothetical protein [Rhodanobacter thiooxydans]|nr:hypothetical protein [Rhodanobacter thiooxydans]MCW0200719.1 hypothetical protein [Rhodanobacter thiooxydans]